MDGNNPGSFAKFFKNEPKTAAYIGYNNVGSFRKLRFHPLTLYWYIAFKEHCWQRNAKGPFAILQSCDRTIFGAGLEELLTNFPTVEDAKDPEAIAEHNRAKDHRYAGILHLMSEDLKDFGAKTYNVATIQEQFQALLPPGCTVPTFNISDVEPPGLGPFEGEDELERFSRVNALLKSLQCVMAPSRWRGTFMKKHTDAFPSKIIGGDSIPVWMRPSYDTVQPLDHQVHQTQQPLICKALLDRTSKSRFEKELIKHESEHITFNAWSLPGEESIERDPRVYPTGSMWRDTVRRQLQFAKLRVDFLTIRLDGLLVYSTSEPNKMEVWSKVVHHLNGLEKASFVYSLQVVQSEDDDYDYEYDGPPLALIDVIEAKDNDAQLIIPEAVAPVEIGSEEFASVTQVDQTALLIPLQDVASSIRMFEESVSIKSQVKPDHFFDPSNQEEFLGHHDG